MVNKADAIQIYEGMRADETKKYVAELVTQQMQMEGFRLLPEQVGG